jgi:PhzF family phenazine biosynthesis protein
MRQWTVDAFSAAPFGGNQACVLQPLAGWPEEAWMQALAAENNVGATAFLTQTGDPLRFGLRWFTPAMEVPLCGHATLAAAHVLLAELGLEAERLVFETRGGVLEVQRAGAGYEMSLPALASRRIETPAGLAEAIGAEPLAVWAGHYLIALIEDPAAVRGLTPDLAAVEAISRALDGKGNLGVAALCGGAEGPDVVDRFFAPGFGLAEDPATGSFHAQLAPILGGRLGRRTLSYHQAYPGRGAAMTATAAGERVLLSGAACTVADSRLRLEPPKVRPDFPVAA